MSYSFRVTAGSKAKAKTQVAAEWDRVVAQQECHKRDRDQALAVANAFIDLLEDDETKDVQVAMNGYLSGHWETGSRLTQVHSATVTVSAALLPRLL